MCLRQNLVKNVIGYLIDTHSLVSGENVLSDMPWKQIKKLWTCPEGLWIFFWLKRISIKEVTRSENSTSPVCKGPGTLGTPSLICFKPKRQIIVLIWQPGNSQLPSSRMHSISNIKLLAPKNEKPFEWMKVGCRGKTLRNPSYTWQVWNTISVNAISSCMVQILN